jgi:RNAse (barnase) inhibitor barstar
MFKLSSEEFSDGVLCCASSAEGLFVDVEDPHLVEISFTGLAAVAEGLERWTKSTSLDFVEVDVMSTTGRMLGHYDLGTAHVLYNVGEAGSSVLLKGAEPVHLVDGLSLWRRWCDDAKPLARNEWVGMSEARRSSWLRIAQSVWGVNGYDDQVSVDAQPASMDGRLVEDETSFYLALGEAMVGPGGYVGSGLDALDDCLAALTASSRSIELEWNHFSESQAMLGHEFLADVVAVAEQRGVSIVVKDRDGQGL